MAEKLESIERRVTRGTEVRAGERDGKPVIEGYAAVFNEESSDLGGFVEIIEPGAFDDALDQDTVGLWNHNDDIPLGRAPNKTLEIAQDSRGLKYVIYINADDPEAMSKHAKVKRGDVNGSSFAFRVKNKERGDEMNGDEWKLVGDKIVRVIKKAGIRDLFDVSPVTYPAYPKASAQARSKADELRTSLQSDPTGLTQAGETGADGPDQAQALLDTLDRRTAVRRRMYQLSLFENKEHES
jgi:HK97 family phage prohead protease